MPTLRDALLPVFSQLRGLPVTFGLRRYAVTIRRRVWTGVYPGDGGATNQDIVISPLPRVRNSFSSSSLSPQALQYILANGNVIDDRYYKIDKITPAFVDGSGNAGGYSPQQMRLRPPPDSTNIEEIVVLVGDDGLRRDCVQVTFEQDRAFGYSMLVHESDRPRVGLASIAITASVSSVVHGTSLQLKATGTFADGDTSDLTPLVQWFSQAPTLATVSTLGLANGVAAGAAIITASLTGVGATFALTVT